MYHDTLMSARIPTETDKPSSAGRWTTAEHEGQLLLFFPSEMRENVKTSRGTTDAVACHRVVDLESGQVYEDTLIFGAALVLNLKGGADLQVPVCGRLAKSDKGAWVLKPHSQEELNVAHGWIQENIK